MAWQFCRARTGGTGRPIDEVEGGMVMALAHQVKAGQSFSLSAIDSDDHGGLTREAGAERLAALGAQLLDLQELLYAAGQHRLLIVLQGLDTSGKDGTIRAVGGFMNPAGCRVESFKVPSTLELSHDFLWRVHRVVPPRGMVGIFNRSHYEDVLVVRVHELVPEAIWRKRYDHINDFERLLTDSQTILIKFYLHISRDEQEQRLIEREHDVEKAWKLSASDWIERRSWASYVAAYEEALTRCSTPLAPWYVVPANRKWFRNLAVAEMLVEALEPYRAEWLAALKERGQRELAAIRESRRQRRPSN
jgi:PPK2 family polyphosphate:nucleotide phosphotransferase